MTGLAILGSGFIQLPRNISSYHWQIMVYLARFSSLTHLTTLTVLRQYFHENPGIRNWRLVFMLVTAGLLLATLIPTGNSMWLTDKDNQVFIGAVPVKCYFRSSQLSPKAYDVKTSQCFTMSASVVIIVYGYTTRIIKLSSKASMLACRWLREKPEDWLGSQLDRVYSLSKRRSLNRGWRFVYFWLCSFYINLRVTFDLFESNLWEVYFPFTNSIQMKWLTGD